MWIFTRNVIENQLYNNFKYNNFPIGSLGLLNALIFDLFSALKYNKFIQFKQFGRIQVPIRYATPY